ncbi:MULTISPECIES: hypothetical protein [Enterococcaceae]|uniref:hypothetical protein n=1 Tax=Enterococcaceae TaxID=81852 RepID=UPI0017860160|nr:MULTISPECIES: hypothetical protein [Enterococcaceae]MDT2745982.1 hypothetical protein [Vagococcus fluvialis]QOG32405.1 hypothetical protein EGM182_16980 [Enterococcus casseliflavus]
MKYNQHIAKEVNNWIRLEAEYTGQYAHDLTEKIKECTTDVELKNLLLGSILDKYMFFHMKSNKPHKITRLMLELLDEQNFHFSTPSPRNNLLQQSIDHLIKGSGLFPTMFKMDMIWGRGTSEEFLSCLYDKYNEEFVPNDDHVGWVKKYKQLYLIEGKPWEVKYNAHY